MGTFTAFFDLSFGLGAVSLGAVAAAFGYRGVFITGALVAAGGLALFMLTIGRDGRSAVASSGERSVPAADLPEQE